MFGRAPITLGIGTHSTFCATVCKTVRPMLSVRCLSVCPVCLSVISVTFVHCSQTVGRIKMKCMQVDLGHGHNVLDGNPASPPQRGTAPPNFRPISAVAKWLDHG